MRQNNGEFVPFVTESALNLTSFGLEHAPAPYSGLSVAGANGVHARSWRGAILNEKKSSRETDLDRLSRLKALSWLSPSELKLLLSALSLSNYKRHALILRDVALAQGAHILISGIARITCRTARNERVTVALLAPGPIPDFPALPLSRSGFQCEAYNDCRVGTVSWADFGGITPNAPLSSFRQFHSNDLKQWYRLLLRS